MWQPMANGAILKRVFKSAVFPSKTSPQSHFPSVKLTLFLRLFLNNSNFHFLGKKEHIESIISHLMSKNFSTPTL